MSNFFPTLTNFRELASPGGWENGTILLACLLNPLIHNNFHIFSIFSKQHVRAWIEAMCESNAAFPMLFHSRFLHNGLGPNGMNVDATVSTCATSLRGTASLCERPDTRDWRNAATSYSANWCVWKNSIFSWQWPEVHLIAFGFLLCHAMQDNRYVLLYQVLLQTFIPPFNSSSKYYPESSVNDKNLQIFRGWSGAQFSKTRANLTKQQFVGATCLGCFKSAGRPSSPPVTAILGLQASKVVRQWPQTLAERCWERTQWLSLQTMSVWF